MGNYLCCCMKKKNVKISSYVDYYSNNTDISTNDSTRNPLVDALIYVENPLDMDNNDRLQQTSISNTYTLPS